MTNTTRRDIGDIEVRSVLQHGGTALKVCSYLLHRYLVLTNPECRFRWARIYSAFVAVPLYLRIKLITDDVVLYLDPQFRCEIFLCFVVWVYYRTACSGPPLHNPPPLHRYYLTLPLFRFFMLLCFILTVLSNSAPYSWESSC